MTLSGRRTLVTGASRPFGIEVVRHCLMRGDRVIATCRSPARVPQLADLRAEFGGLDLIPLDPADAASVTEAVPVLQELTDSLDLLVIAPAEAGVHERASDTERDAVLETMSGTGLVEHYRRHAVAPVLLVRTLLPFLEAAGDARVLVISTGDGSLSEKSGGGAYATSASGVALNMLVRALAFDLAALGITVCLGDPGRSALVPEHEEQPVTLSETAAGLLGVAERMSAGKSGMFLDWTGAELRW